MNIQKNSDDKSAKEYASFQKKERRLAFTNTLLFETPGGLRFTQDSPILPNVWLAYAAEPRSQQELILTVSNKSGTGVAAFEIRKMLTALRAKFPHLGVDKKILRDRARVSYIPGQIAVKLYFDELMRVVLPLTPWWHQTYDFLKKIERDHQSTACPADWTPFPQPDENKKREKDLTEALMQMRREIAPLIVSENIDEHSVHSEKTQKNRIKYIREIPPDLIWIVRITGLIADCFHSGTGFFSEDNKLSWMMDDDFQARYHDRIETTEEREIRIANQKVDDEHAREAREGIVSAFVNLYENWSPNNEYPKDRVIWRVTKNRRIHLAVAKSAMTVKADAARRVFDISCKNITWAVIDSGIDPRHPAFKLTTEQHENEVRRAKAKEGDSNGLAPKIRSEDLDSRVKMTLDFTRLRELLDFDIDDGIDNEGNNRRDRLIAEIATRMTKFNHDVNNGHDKSPDKESLKRAEKLLEKLRERISEGREISWQDLESAIVVQSPDTPINDHGTHVAGILGADWIADIRNEDELPLKLRTRRMQGVCPDINLIDVRVFREDGLTDEFELLAAIQFLRWMNARAGTMRVHGANISLSLIHEVRRFACGQTPVCDECNEASALGMVMVAAAGNRGFELSDMDQVRASDSYKSVSITDPGNADSVITVGSTHRKRPHEYGVSYFSSRGPTGDGRLKPDVVAPGEKIKGPTPNERAEYKDGTSMAAPHVSGISAMLMARHTELIGQPARIKSILCETATDLGRERYFQGHGLVDGLRALQSI